MKVALVDPSLFTWPYDNELVGGLQAAGHDVMLYGTPPSWQESRAVPSFLCPFFYRSLHRGVWGRLPKPLFRVLKGVVHLGDMMRFCSEMERLRPDVIHFQWLPLPMVDSWFLRRLRRVAPLVLTVHDTLPFNGAPGSAVQSLGAFAVFRRFDSLIVHTERGRELVAAQVGSAERVRCIPHGLLHQHQIEAADAGGSASANPGDRPLTFLQFGYIKPYKGVDVLIRALAELDSSARARCRVRVVGKAFMDIAPLEALAAQLGVADLIEIDQRFVSSSELDDIFRSADVLVFPYRQIEASGVLMTAIAVGKPVIATRLGAAAELFADEKGGSLIPADDPAALARAMDAFIRSPALVESCAAHVRRLRDAIPSWPEIGGLTTAAYEGAHRHWQPGSPMPETPGVASARS